MVIAMSKRFIKFYIIALLTSCLNAYVFAGTDDPLPSWRDGPTKQSIINFVEGVIDEKSAEFAPPEDRVATFDNDGTLWSEQPMYFQLFFAIDRVKALAPQNPAWKTQQPFKAVLENDMQALADTIRERVALMPEHGRFLADYCPANAEA